MYAGLGKVGMSNSGVAFAVNDRVLLVYDWPM